MGYGEVEVSGTVGVSLPSRYWIGVEGTVRDRFWVFCCPANSDYGSLGRRSVMTPAEAAFYLDVPNVIVVQSGEPESRYGRFEPPFAQYAIALRPFRRLAWSVVGSCGFTSESETKEVLDLARSTPNIIALMLDDFFTGRNEEPRARLGLEDLRRIRHEATSGGKRLDLFVTYYYRRFLGLDLNDYLEMIDVVTLWAREEEIGDLEETLSSVERAMPGKRIMLGCYMFEYTHRRPTPIALMEMQCETGLRWLRDGRIEGMIFLGNTVADFDFPSVEWTRRWIRNVGDRRL